MRILTASAFLILTTGAAQAQVSTDESETFLATGVIAPMYGYPIGTLDSGATPKVGETLQFEYTVDPSTNPTDIPGVLGPITAIAYSVNGAPFYSDLASYQLFGNDYNFTLYPGNGAEISLSSANGSMLVYDLGGAGAYANITNIKEILPTSAPEIDSAGLAGGLTLLVGGLLVIQSRRSRDIRTSSV
jgi:hypothetical protein